VIGESRNYKNQLLRFANKLDAWHHQTRWTDSRFDEYEYRVFCSFFIIRRLLECNKLSERIAQREVPVDVYKPTGERVTLMSRYDVWELYDLSHPSRERRPLPFICNQVIHSYIFQIWSERGGVRVVYSSALTVSVGALPIGLLAEPSQVSSVPSGQTTQAVWMARLTRSGRTLCSDCETNV
jgi:hypothetical protein